MRFSAIAVALAIAAGCAPVGFDVPYDVPEITLPGDPGATAPTTFTVDIALPEHPVDGVSDVTLSSLAFAITKGSGCFAFVDAVDLTLESDKPGSALPPVVVASGSDAGCVQTFTLSTSGVNVKPYLDEGARIRAECHGVRPATAVTFDGHVVLHATL